MVSIPRAALGADDGADQVVVLDRIAAGRDQVDKLLPAAGISFQDRRA
ncbi:MAG: hypothetical protein R3F11_20010 [Verrucomicrobiales bacterium]